MRFYRFLAAAALLSSSVLAATGPGTPSRCSASCWSGLFSTDQSSNSCSCLQWIGRAQVQPEARSRDSARRKPVQVQPEARSRSFLPPTVEQPGQKMIGTTDPATTPTEHVVDASPSEVADTSHQTRTSPSEVADTSEASPSEVADTTSPTYFADRQSASTTDEHPPQQSGMGILSVLSSAESLARTSGPASSEDEERPINIALNEDGVVPAVAAVVPRAAGATLPVEAPLSSELRLRDHHLLVEIESGPLKGKLQLQRVGVLGDVLTDCKNFFINRRGSPGSDEFELVGLGHDHDHDLTQIRSSQDQDQPPMQP